VERRAFLSRSRVASRRIRSPRPVGRPGDALAFARGYPDASLAFAGGQPGDALAFARGYPDASLTCAGGSPGDALAFETVARVATGACRQQSARDAGRGGVPMPKCCPQWPRHPRQNAVLGGQMDRMRTNSEVSPTILQRSTLLQMGDDDRGIRRLRAAGIVTPVRRGAYSLTADQASIQPWERHALVVTATVPKLGSGAVVSHVPAAALHDLALWPTRLLPVHISRRITGGGRRTRTLHLHPASLVEGDIVAVNGLSVTSVTRTVIDVARTEPFETGVVAADEALRRGLTTREELLDGLASQRGRAGCYLAARVVAFADGRSESVGESRSRVAILRMGLEPPELQVNVHDVDGVWLARADFAYVQ
jgi:hypothetical protein